MNGLIGQLPEWMRSPAALIAGGLILLFLLVVLLRRSAGAAAHGLPSGRGWRGKVPLPTQASSLERMRAALEASGRSERFRQTAASPPMIDDAPSEGVVAPEANLKVDAEATQEAEGPSAQDARGPEVTASAGEQAAKVVPLRAGSASAPDRSEPVDDAEDEGDEAVVPEAAREQKG